MWLNRQQLLIGADACERLRHSQVCICGLGGVGSAAAEAVCRAGVGTLILVDHDCVDLTNLNRQIVATRDCIGQKKVAAMAHNGFARAIRPVHTTADGDSIYAMSVGNIQADLDVVGTLAATVMARAIKNAVLHAKSLGGYPSARELSIK